MSEERTIEVVRRVEVPERFQVLDLCAWLEFDTASSLGYALGKADPFELTSAGPRGGEFEQTGRLDVHYPCRSEDNRVQIVVIFFKPRSLDDTAMNAFVTAVFAALRIPERESYRAEFCAGGSCERVESERAEFVTYAIESSDDGGQQEETTE